MDTHRSSGDLLADRRYLYAQACLAEGDAGACADLAGQALEIAPAYAPAWLLLGQAREALFSASGDPAEGAAARDAYETARRLDPEDALGAGLHLARLGHGEGSGEGALTPAYLRALFDGYAPRFERHLVEGLHYVGPALVAEVLPEEPARFSDVLDLGCGTGLAGAAVAGRAGRMTGVDLSPAMLAKARAKGCYDRLEEGELGAFLSGEPEASADLCIAADVFIYCHDLGPVLAGIGRVLRPGGWVAFTVQSPDSLPSPIPPGLAPDGVSPARTVWGGDSGSAAVRHPAPPLPSPASESHLAAPILGRDGRYAHPDAHIRRAVEAAGLVPRVLRGAAVRYERGGPVPGRIVAAQRRAG